MQATQQSIKPYIIGLTGKIGSGKSLVRKMLEHLGALTVDADYFAHHVYRRGSEGYYRILKTFGKEIVNSQDQIDRKLLGEMVFADQILLKKLEDIIHPLVITELEQIINRSSLPIVAVEAIKLFESNFNQQCDSIWLVETPKAAIKERLHRSRALSSEQIDARLRTQLDLEEKKAYASAIINNSHSVKATWQAVQLAWENTKFTSQKFFRAEKESKCLLKPVQKCCVMADNTASQKFLRDVLSQTRQFINSDGNLKELNNLFELYGEDDAAWKEDFFTHLLCTHHIWKYLIQNDATGFLIANLNHFKAVVLIGGFPETHHLSFLKERITNFERFCSLHMVTEIDVHPIKEIFGTSLQELGYHKCIVQKSHTLTYKAEYNVYKKAL